VVKTILAEVDPKGERCVRQVIEGAACDDAARVVVLGGTAAGVGAHTGHNAQGERSILGAARDEDERADSPRVVLATVGRGGHGWGVLHALWIGSRADRRSRVLERCARYVRLEVESHLCRSAALEQCRHACQ
jgi:hypothetical protein